MREIKFRAWDSEEKKMLLPDGIYGGDYSPFPNTNIIVDLLAESINDNWGADELTERYVLMQYTGLQDKNGKEIYEGDIVCVCNNKHGYFQVIFVNAYVGGWLLQHPEGTMSLGARDKKDLEIIGNIYENPELVEVPE